MGYHSPLGLHDFQADGVAYAYLSGNALATWSTGLGKTHLGLALASLLFEDGLIDHAFVICEGVKIAEWLEDFEEFTDLEAERYHGTPAKRAKLRENLSQVMVSTYETTKNDSVVWQRTPRGKISNRKPDDGPLIEALRGKRVLLVYDEATKLKSRTSGNHRAHLHLRKALGARVLSLTATPVETGIEDVFNIVRVTDPGIAGKVTDFERDHVMGRDEYGRALQYVNISPDFHRCDPNVTPFVKKIEPIFIRKSKDDPDVREAFPQGIEEFSVVPMTSAQQRFYDSVYDEWRDSYDAQVFLTLRQIAAHPQSLAFSEGELQRSVIEEVGPTELAKMGSGKLDFLEDLVGRIVDAQREQVVVYSFFGQSVLPLLRSRLTESWGVAYVTGGMPQSERERAVQSFKDGRLPILLTSDVTSRGINLPNASYIVQYELPFTYAMYDQRRNRNHRMGMGSDRTVVNHSLVAKDTIEDGVQEVCWDRNELSDQVLGEPTADQRRALMDRARESLSPR